MEGENRIFATGELLDGIYEIMLLLGRGGMGQVFEAHDHLLNRRVAIKAAWPNPLSPPLRNEARALAAFQHPSLVSVHTLGEHRGIDYLVMERVYGVSLTQHAATRWGSGERFSPAEVVQILLPASEGLSVVHRAGLVHRDIKPDNIMLTPAHRVVLMDFGLVLPEFDVNGQQRVAGSPPYMAPEALFNTAATGSGHLIDNFGLGVVAYELLTGRRPFAGITIREVIASHERGQPTPLAELRPDCPLALCQVIHEMLSPNPQVRIQSAEAVAWQMRSIRDERPRSDSPAVTSKKGPSVLIVDDDVDLAKILTFYVRQIIAILRDSRCSRWRRGPERGPKGRAGRDAARSTHAAHERCRALHAAQGRRACAELLDHFGERGRTRARRPASSSARHSSLRRKRI